MLLLYEVILLFFLHALVCGGRRKLVGVVSLHPSYRFWRSSRISGLAARAVTGRATDGPTFLTSYLLNKFNVMVKFHLKQNNPNKFMCNNFQWFFSMTKGIIIHEMR